MIKNTTINSTLTPAPNLDLAGSIVGRVEEAQLRWSPGSLVAGILGNSATQQTVLISPGKVVSGEIASGALMSLIASGLYSTGLAGDPVTFSAIAGVTKSKLLEVPGLFTPSASVYDETTTDDSTDPLILTMLLPTQPSFTALSAINKILSLFENDAWDDERSYFLIVDQESESITVAKYTTEANADAALAYLAADEDFEIAVAYDTVVPPPDTDPSGIPSFGWE